MEAVQIYQSEQVQKLSENDIDTLVQANIIPKGTPDSQVKLFARVCFEKGLSPFSKQIHLIPRKNKSGDVTYNHQTSIDGYRLIAERTGKYAGSDDYLFDDNKTEYEMITDNRTKPTTATAIVYKILPNGTPFAIRATARWDEYYPGDFLGFMWKKMPFLMLGKCAEALALRKAFPEALSGIYTDEEMQQADIETKPEKPQNKPKQIETPAQNKPKEPNYTEIAEGFKTVEELKTWYKGLNKDLQVRLKNLVTHCKEKLEQPTKADEIIPSMINNSKNIEDLERVDNLINSIKDKAKRAAYIDLLQEKTATLKVNYTIKSVPF